MMSSRLHVRPRGLVRTADYPPGATFGPRRLPDHEFVWLLRGTARWRVEEGPEGQEVELRPGVLALARAGTTDGYRWDARRPSTHAYVHFAADTTALPPGTQWPRTRTLGDQDPMQSLCSYLLRLAETGDDEARARSDQVVGWLLELFVRGPFAGEGTPGLAVPSTLREPLELVRARWQAGGMCLVRVDELAAAAHVSGAHLSRVFAATFGCGPASALELVRLARAAVVLQRSNLTLVEVARLTGFADAYHFSKRFAAAYGVPPGRFRRAGEDQDPLAPVVRQGMVGLFHHLTGGTVSGRTTGSARR